ncbi:SCO family protein [Candidatus Methylacidithermus pantelleriae]|uniref:Cu2+-binding oxygen sensor (SCO1/SenC/PrrC family) n=1 Tax=Candidatus Methylacidithermus pantelleriae TaxID=2744239 RepID=A0A8J2BSP0_9BACT|nr:SCO family protein [Candidatus Methylacidithermus pantelleriae]CAF0695867.1 Cu2+-binding oxygen sensor (SCO1/SenC/PrrC family) [Candidatus Methylacidithermus pantelleriae]
MKVASKTDTKFLIRLVLVLFFALVLIGMGINSLYFYFAMRVKRQFETEPLPRYREVPAFSLVDLSHQPVTRDSLRGKIWVAEFFYATCPGPCGIQSQRMQELQTILQQAKIHDVRLVSFSLDPQHDTPEVLAEYARRYKADPSLWFFLTGDPEQIRTLLLGGFRLAYAENPPEARPLRGKYTHATQLVLVDGQGVIRGYYDGLKPDTPTRVIQDIFTLLNAEILATEKGGRS